MMDGVHDDEEGGDYFFPLGVTQEAAVGGGRSSNPAASVMMRD